MNEIPYIKLNNGVLMPQLGYGMYEIHDLAACESYVRQAIRLGYRLFDTAAAYFNEDALGKACASEIAVGNVKREDLFLTTKVWLQDFGTEATRQAVKVSMEKMGTYYIDLVLLHQPYGNWQEAWKTLEELQKEGLVRAIGTSNFTPEKMKELLGFAEAVPQVNQMEIHPFFSEKNYAELLKKRNIQTEAWGPLCEGLKDIFTNPLLMKIGSRYGKSAAQTALRWNLQNGNIIIPRSTKQEHMKEDLEIFDFELTAKEMQEIDELDIGHSEIIDFHNPSTERLLMKLKIHEDIHS